MDTTQRFDTISDYLLECFASGNFGASKNYVIDG
jgi:hypothetical protein